MSKVPKYYIGKSGRPAWDTIEDFGLNYYRGCALKYIVRAGRKTNDPREDLRKALHCIERELELAEADPPSRRIEVMEKILHPNGRCTCGGEGDCDWCRRDPNDEGCDCHECGQGIYCEICADVVGPK